MQKFRASILPGGDGLKPSGRLIKAGSKILYLIAKYGFARASRVPAAVAANEVSYIAPHS